MGQDKVDYTDYLILKEKVFNMEKSIIFLKERVKQVEKNTKNKIIQMRLDQWKK